VRQPQLEVQQVYAAVPGLAGAMTDDYGHGTSVAPGLPAR
jgi:hypothetical protein